MRELPISCLAALKGGAEIRITKIQDPLTQRHDNRRAAECVDSLFRCVAWIERIRGIDAKSASELFSERLKPAAPGFYLLLCWFPLIFLWNEVFQILIQIEHCLELINGTDLDVELFLFREIGNAVLKERGERSVQPFH